MPDHPKKHSLFGPTFFKLGFSFKTFHYPGAHNPFYDPLLGFLFDVMVSRHEDTSGQKDFTPLFVSPPELSSDGLSLMVE